MRDNKTKEEMLVRVIGTWGNKAARKVLQCWRVVVQRRRTAVFLMGAVLSRCVGRRFDELSGGPRAVELGRGLKAISTLVSRKLKSSGWTQFNRGVV